MLIHDVDKSLGIDVYVTRSEGIGGIIRESVDDFIVEEVLVDGSKARVHGEVPSIVLGSTCHKQRYLLCVLVKRSWDTFIATMNIAKALGIDQTRVQFAGIKDAKAITSQFISIENVSMEEMAKVKIKEIDVHTIGYIREMMSLFYLLGNSFTITIKSIKNSETKIKENIAQTMTELNTIGGIPNFFGHQRFGTTRPITHLVGKAIIQGNIREAAMLFLAKPSAYEHPASMKVRQDLQLTEDFKNAQLNFPKQLRFERIMLNYIVDNPGDYYGAFKSLPFRLQALFVQAYQSYLFNRFLGERLKSSVSLNEALVGDFVVGVERSGLPMTAMARIVTAENQSEINTQIKAQRLFVALPIFGVKQKLSQGFMGQIEREVLEKEGIDIFKLQVNQLSRAWIRGGLRSVIAPLKESKMQNVSVIQEGEEFKAKLSFMLLRGSYATVVLREIMKPSNPITAGF